MNNYYKWDVLQKNILVLYLKIGNNEKIKVSQSERVRQKETGHLSKCEG